MSESNRKQATRYISASCSCYNNIFAVVLMEILLKFFPDKSNKLTGATG